MTDETTTAEVVYLGHRTLRSGKLGEAWVTLALFNNDTAADRCELFPKAKRGRYIIGGIYSGTVKLDDNGNLSSLRVGDYVRRLPHSAALVALHAASEAADQRKRQADLEKRLADDDGLDRDMAALRAAWRATPYPDRAAFELMVLRRLRNG